MRVRIAAAMFIAGLLTVGGLFGFGEADGSSLPTTCAVVSADVKGSTTTITHDSDGMTCPTLPPSDPSNPCPGGDDVHDDREPVTGVSYFVMVCVKGL